MRGALRADTILRERDYAIIWCHATILVETDDTASWIETAAGEGAPARVYEVYWARPRYLTFSREDRWQRASFFTFIDARHVTMPSPSSCFTLPRVIARLFSSLQICHFSFFPLHYIVSSLLLPLHVSEYRHSFIETLLLYHFSFLPLLHIICLPSFGVADDMHEIVVLYVLRRLILYAPGLPVYAIRHFTSHAIWDFFLLHDDAPLLLRCRLRKIISFSFMAFLLLHRATRGHATR